MVYYRKRYGKWEYRISYKDIHGKYRQHSKGGFQTKSEAKIAAEKAEQSIRQNPEAIKNKDISLSDYLEQWINTYKLNNVAENTRLSLQTTLRAVKLFFGQTQLRQITPTSYQNILNKMGEHYRRSSLNKIHSTVKSCVNYAIQDRIIDYNFTSLAKVVSTVSEKDISEKYLELDEYQKLLKDLEEQSTSSFKHLQLLVIATTGIRWSESLGITWEDVDFDEQTISINKQWGTLIDSGFETLKTTSSERIVPINQTVAEHLKYYQKHFWKDNDYNRVFPNFDRKNVATLLKKIVGRNVHIHSLRHTFASFLIANDIDVMSVSKVLGHKNMEITLKTYAHLFDAKKEEQFDKIKSLF